MSVNGVTNYNSNSYSYYSADSKNETAKTTESNPSTGESASGVVYEPSKDTAAVTKTQKYKPDEKTIARMKADAEERKAQLMDLVHKMLNGQTSTYGKANDIWSSLSGGNLNVSDATKAQAQADIAEDGYWGVEQTSQRIMDFATALTGGDPEKIEEMRSAFEKGYKMAEETWGGKLPDISQKTYDAVMSGFDKMAEDAGIN